MDYNAAAVLALGAVDHYGRCSADEVRQGFVARKDLGMRAVVAEREQVLGVQGENEVMGLSILEKSQKAKQQVENTATA